MTHRELITVPVFADDDICIDCNFSGQQVDFGHLHVTLQECNMYNAAPLNAENVTLIETPSFGKQSTPEPVAIPTNPTLSALAIAVNAILQASEKLDSATKSELNQLVAGVSSVANVTPDPADAATLLTQQILSDPMIQGVPGLAEQIQAALTQIQTSTGGTL